MFAHHKKTIDNVIKKLSPDPAVLAVLVGGSVAHGFEKKNSDIDIMIIVTEDEYARRKEKGGLLYWENESCTGIEGYDEGYVDGKYMDMAFLNLVKEKGSDAARYAFKDSIIAFSRQEGLEELIGLITAYPEEQKADRIKRFYAQVNAWHWYYHEAKKHQNDYLISHSLSNLILFAGRLILTHNRTLYPYHKWFLRVLENVKEKPENLIGLINAALAEKSPGTVDTLFEAVKNFRDWGVEEYSWPAYFMADSEQNWIDHPAPVTDL